MATDHRGNFIPDPHLTHLQNLKDNLRILWEDSSPIGAEEYARERYGIPEGGKGFSALEGRSEMGDADLMPDTGAPISTTERAFGESGHGFSVRKGKAGQ